MTDDGDAPTDPPSTTAADGPAPAPADDLAAPGPAASAAAAADPVPAPVGTRDELPVATARIDEPAPATGHAAYAGEITVRQLDDAVGAVERALLFVALMVLILTGIYRTALSLIWHDSSLKAIEVSRISAFAIGIFGAAYAAQSQRNFGLDLVSALMSTRVKAWTRVFTNLAALVAAGLLVYGGRRIQDALAIEKQHYEIIPIWVVGWFIPIAAGLIMFHVFLHLVIEIDYLRRGKTAPEPEVVG